MIIEINKEMEYLSIGENELTVFNPKSGDTHFFDEIGTAILAHLNKPSTEIDLIKWLAAEYTAPRHEIESDVKEFLNDLKEKGIVQML